MALAIEHLLRADTQLLALARQVICESARAEALLECELGPFVDTDREIEVSAKRVLDAPRG
jgi:hypothetical protein